MNYCIIKGGKANIPGNYLNGGGIYCLNSQPVISYCTITDNWATMYGGGIYLSYSSPVISNCLIANNTAHNYQGAKGGGIACEFQSNPIIENCLISGNYAGDDGGGIYCYLSAPRVYGCVIEDNQAVEWGGGICNGWNSDILMTGCFIEDNMAGEGGGIYFYDSDAIIDSCFITGNWCEGGNPPYSHNYGGGIFLGYQAGSNGSNLIMINSVIQNNDARNGGGIYNEYLCRIKLTDCIIEDNIAVLDGGGIYSTSTSVLTVMQDTKIAGNEAGRLGGGFYVSGTDIRLQRCVLERNEAGLNGGGLYCNVCENTNLWNMVFYDNSAENNGSALFLNSSPTSLLNSIVCANSGHNAIYFSNAAGSELGYNDFFDNEGGNFAGIGIPANLGMIAGVNANRDSCDHYRNIYQNPLFLDPTNHDFHLMEASPCIDAGDPQSPPDPDSTIADMGAFYFDQNEEDPNFTLSRKREDFNEEKIVSIASVNSGQFSVELKQFAYVEISVYNVLGRLVAKINDDPLPPGEYYYSLENLQISCGMYFLVLQVEGEIYTIKMVKLK